MNALLVLLRSLLPVAGAETPPQTEEGAAPAEGGTEGEENGSQGLDLSPVMERMDEVAGRLDQFGQRLDEATQPPPEDEFAGQQPQEPDIDWDQLAGLDPQDPQVQAAIQREEAQRAAQAAVQEAVAPMLQQQQQERIEAEGEDLLEEYPELQQEQNAAALNQDAQVWASDIAKTLGNPQLASLAGVPAFLELVHLAAKTAERAGEETPAGQGNQGQVTLEGGSAPNSGSAQETAKPLGERIQEATPSRGFWT